MVISASFAVVIISAFILKGITIWLNTDSGTAWLESKLQKELAGTGYTIEINHFLLSSPFGIGAQNFALKQNGLTVIDAHDLSLSLNILSLPLKTARISLGAKTVSVESLPVSKTQDNKKNDIFPLLLPDIYFKELALNSDIHNFILSEKIVNGGFKAHIILNQSVTNQGRNLNFSSAIKLMGIEYADAAYLPSTIVAHMALDTQTGDLSFLSLNAENAGYDIMVNGHYNLTQDVFETNAQLNIQDPSRDIDASLSKPLNIKTQLSGSLESISGTVSTESAISGHDISLTTPIFFQDNRIDLTEVKGEYDNAPFSGALQFSFPREDAQSAFYTLKAKDWLYKETKIDFVNASIELSDGSSHITLDGSGHDVTPFTLFANLDLPSGGKTEAIINELNVGLAGGRLSALGEIHPEKLAVKVTLSDIDPSKLPFSLIDDFPTLLIKSGSAELSGSLQSPTLTSEMIWKGLAGQSKELGLVTGTSYKEDKLIVTLATQGGGKSTLHGEVSMPATVSFEPFELSISEKAPLGGNLQGNIVLADISPLLLADVDQTIKGDLQLNAKVSGTLGTPIIDGSASIKNGYFYDPTSNIELNKITGKARFTPSIITLDNLTAKDRNSGLLQANGMISIADLQNPAIDLKVKASAMNLSRNSLMNSKIDADLSLKNCENSFLLSGTITPKEVIITLPDRFGETIPKLNIVKRGDTPSAPWADRIKMDIIFDAKNKIFVRGWGLDSELGGSLKIQGTINTPDVEGTLSTLRGRYEEFGKKFNIDHANLRFQGTIPPSPYLDVLAQTQAEDITAQVLITGKADQPKLELKSVPALPQDEVLSRILFGKDSSKITPFQAIQLAQSIQRLSGNASGPNFDPLGEIRSLTGLDDITVDTEKATVGAGKYINDKIYMELEQGKAEGSGAASVKVEVSPHVSVESEARRNGSGGAGVFWGWDY